MRRMGSEMKEETINECYWSQETYQLVGAGRLLWFYNERKNVRLYLSKNLFKTRRGRPRL